MGGQKLIEWSVTGECRRERFGEQLGVDERIADPLRRDRISVVAGVTNERPSLAVRFAEVPGYTRGAIPPLFAMALPDAGSEIRRCLERSRQLSINVGADGRKVAGRPVDHHEMETVGGRRPAKR